MCPIFKVGVEYLDDEFGLGLSDIDISRPKTFPVVNNEYIVLRQSLKRCIDTGENVCLCDVLASHGRSFYTIDATIVPDFTPARNPSGAQVIIYPRTLARSLLLLGKTPRDMTRYQIENLLQTLAMSQGFYGRLLNQIYSLNDEDQERVWEELENQHFGSDLDVVLYFEA